MKEIEPGSFATFVGVSGRSGLGRAIDLNYGQTGQVYLALRLVRRDRQRFFFVADGDPSVKTHLVLRTDFRLFGEDRPASFNPRYDRAKRMRGVKCTCGCSA